MPFTNLRRGIHHRGLEKPSTWSGHRSRCSGRFSRIIDVTIDRAGMAGTVGRVRLAAAREKIRWLPTGAQIVG
jgi:hypothetical protein